MKLMISPFALASSRGTTSPSLTRSLCGRSSCKDKKSFIRITCNGNDRALIMLGLCPSLEECDFGSGGTSFTFDALVLAPQPIF